MKFEIIGEIPSKKNTLRFTRYGKPYQAKHKEMDGLIMQLVVQKNKYDVLPIIKQCKLEVVVSGSDRQDLNNTITTICDLLENAGIVKNDRLIKDIRATKFVDNKRKWVNIEIS